MSVVQVEELSGAALDVLWQLFKNGPTWDGDLSSKRGRDQLVRLNLAQRGCDGWQWLTEDGVQAALDRGTDDRKRPWPKRAHPHPGEPK